MKSTILLLIPISAFFLMLSSGCTVLGYYAGSAADDHLIFGYVPATQEALFDLSEGDSLVVEDADAPPRTVVFMERGLPEETRLLRTVADAGREAESADRLRPGERMRLSLRNDSRVIGICLGATEVELWYAEPGVTRVRKCAFDDLRQLRSGALRLVGNFDAAVENGTLPAVYELLVRDSTGVLGIPMHAWERLRVPDHSSTGRVIGAAVGLALDIALVGQSGSGGIWSGDGAGRMLQSVGAALGAVSGK